MFTTVTEIKTWESPFCVQQWCYNLSPLEGAQELPRERLEFKENFLYIPVSALVNHWRIFLPLSISFSDALCVLRIRVSKQTDKEAALSISSPVASSSWMNIQSQHIVCFSFHVRSALTKWDLVQLTAQVPPKKAIIETCRLGDASSSETRDYRYRCSQLNAG